MMEAIAKGKNLRGSARKARLVLDQIRGKNVNDVKQILDFSTKYVSFKVEKILDSAIANLYEKEGKADLSKYIVSKAYADDGPIMRRYMPRGLGRATIVRKRTCHITLVISEDESGNGGKRLKTSRKVTEKVLTDKVVPERNPGTRTDNIKE